MRILLVLLFFSLTFSSFGQTGKLTLSLSYNGLMDEKSEDTAYFTLHISNQATSISKTILVEWGQGEMSIDSLLPNDYLLQINNTEPDSMLLYQCRFTIRKLTETILYIDLGPDKYYYDIEEETTNRIIAEHGEVQFELGYFNNRWTETDPKLTSSASATISSSYWRSFSRHFGMLAGAGIGLNHSSFSKDTLFFNAPQFDKRYEYYNYLYLSPEVKLRFTLKSQYNDDLFQKGLLFDVGARYHFPFLFKHIGWFAGNTKIAEGGLHQFTDLRTFVSIGRAPFVVFAEYRLLDFVLGNYPELPKYTMGIRILFQH